MHAGLQVAVLGPLQVSVGGHEVGPGGALRRSLVAVLALRAGEVVPVEALVDGLWGDAPPQSATGVLQTYVSTWRKAFEGPVSGRGSPPSAPVTGCSARPARPSCRTSAGWPRTPSG
jgi:DNA-binding SARP family transcriptional activator